MRGKGHGQVRAFRQLVVAAGHVEDQPERIELRETGAECRIQIQSRLRRTGDARVRVPGAGAADAAKAIGGGGHLRLQHGPHPRSGSKVRVADDARRDLGLAVEARGRHRRDAVGELHLADILHLLRPIGAVHGKMLDEHRRDDVVAALQVAAATRPAGSAFRSDLRGGPRDDGAGRRSASRDRWSLPGPAPTSRRSSPSGHLPGPN